MKKSAFKISIAFVLTVAIIAASVMTTGCLITDTANTVQWEQSIVQPENPATDKDKDGENKFPATPANAVVKHNGSLVVTTYSTDESLISLYSEAVPSDIMTTAEGGYTLTASVYPANADNQAVNWTVSWDNPNSAWAKNKTVTNYVTITPSSAGSLTATANCKEAFGEKIKITATSEDNPEASAICICDYVKRFKGFVFVGQEMLNNFPSEGFLYGVRTTDYTIDSNVAVNFGNTITLTKGFANAVSAAFNKITSKYQYGTDWNFASDRSVHITTDYNTKKITFNAQDKDFAGCFTYPDDEYDSSEISNIQSDINTAFYNSCSYVLYHATFTVSYSVTYNGTIFSSGEMTIEFKFKDFISFAVNNY